jgi:hypothetical protein
MLNLAAWNNLSCGILLNSPNNYVGAHLNWHEVYIICTPKILSFNSRGKNRQSAISNMMFMLWH